MMMQSFAYQWLNNMYGCVDTGVESEMFSLGLKGRFYANVFFRPKGKILHHACRSVHSGEILRRYFGGYPPQY